MPIVVRSLVIICQPSVQATRTSSIHTYIDICIGFLQTALTHAPSRTWLLSSLKLGLLEAMTQLWKWLDYYDQSEEGCTSVIKEFKDEAMKEMCVHLAYRDVVQLCAKIFKKHDTSLSFTEMSRVVPAWDIFKRTALDWLLMSEAEAECDNQSVSILSPIWVCTYANAVHSVQVRRTALNFSCARGAEMLTTALALVRNKTGNTGRIGLSARQLKRA